MENQSGKFVISAEKILCTFGLRLLLDRLMYIVSTRNLNGCVEIVKVNCYSVVVLAVL